MSAPEPSKDGACTLEQVMAQALAMEREAVQRYSEFADAMEMHNNREVAALFRTMAGYENKHAEQIMAEMGWTAATEPAAVLPWPGFEAPESVAFDAVHYLMQPWHALQLALAAERRAEAFFGALAGTAGSAPVRHAALELQAEEQEHVALLRDWIEKLPLPDADWAIDPDPPCHTD